MCLVNYSVYLIESSETTSNIHISSSNNISRYPYLILLTILFYHSLLFDIIITCVYLQVINLSSRWIIEFEINCFLQIFYIFIIFLSSKGKKPLLDESHRSRAQAKPAELMVLLTWKLKITERKNVSRIRIYNAAVNTIFYDVICTPLFRIRTTVKAPKIVSFFSFANNYVLFPACSTLTHDRNNNNNKKKKKIKCCLRRGDNRIRT